MGSGLFDGHAVLGMNTIAPATPRTKLSFPVISAILNYLALVSHSTYCLLECNLCFHLCSGTSKASHEDGLCTGLERARTVWQDVSMEIPVCF
jgi:hypothetical protein